jgi:hypothetical protein
VSGRLGLALSGLCALLAGCETPAAEPGRFLLDRGHESLDAGDLERALFYSESALQQDPFEPTREEIALHVEVLRKLSRYEEAGAFAEFAARYAAGEQTDAIDTVPSRNECKEIARKRSKATRLIREYGDLPVRRQFQIGVLAASYEIDATGRPVHLHVIRARHPASAWLIIASISELEIWKSRLASRSEPFPIPHCAYWDEAIPKKIFIPPRMMR